MNHSVDFCRAQEALQLAKMQNEPLENRRKIALAAAKAWSTAAMQQQERALKQGQRSKLDTEIALEFANEQPEPNEDDAP